MGGDRHTVSAPRFPRSLQTGSGGQGRAQEAAHLWTRGRRLVGATSLLVAALCQFSPGGAPASHALTSAPPTASAQAPSTQPEVTCATGATSRVSIASDGAQGNVATNVNPYRAHSLSADG